MRTTEYIWVPNEASCPHCLATWRQRPGRRETSGALPIACPRCKRPLKMEPGKPCWCRDCTARREQGEVPRPTLKRTPPALPEVKA